MDSPLPTALHPAPPIAILSAAKDLFLALVRKARWFLPPTLWGKAYCSGIAVHPAPGRDRRWVQGAFGHVNPAQAGSFRRTHVCPSSDFAIPHAKKKCLHAVVRVLHERSFPRRRESMDCVLRTQRSNAYTLSRELISFGKVQKKPTKENAFPRHSTLAVRSLIAIFGLAFVGCAVKVRPARAARTFTGARADGSQPAPAHPGPVRKRWTSLSAALRVTGYRTWLI